LEVALSQVIVTKDVLQAKRDTSRTQEEKISQDARIRKWSKSDISGKDPLALMAGIAFLPVLAAWACILAIMMFMMTCLRYLFKGLGLIVGGSKSLTIKNKP